MELEQLCLGIFAPIFLILLTTFALYQAVSLSLNFVFLNFFEIFPWHSVLMLCFGFVLLIFYMIDKDNNKTPCIKESTHPEVKK